MDGTYILWGYVLIWYTCRDGSTFVPQIPGQCY